VEALAAERESRGGSSLVGRFGGAET